MQYVNKINMGCKNTSGGIILKYYNKSYYVLCVKQWNNLWSPPKGSIESNESRKRCAQREIHEETSLFIPYSKFICRYGGLYIINGEQTFITEDYNKSEILQIKWININNLIFYDMNSFLKRIYRFKNEILDIYQNDKNNKNIIFVKSK